MNNLMIFEERQVLGKDFKIYGTKENPYFLAKDVSKWIDHTDTSKMLKSIDEEEKVKNIVRTLGGNQEMWFLTEDGINASKEPWMQTWIYRKLAEKMSRLNC